MQIDLTAAIVSAYVSNNQITPDNLPGLIQQVYKSLFWTIDPTVDVVAPLIPAVPIRKSVHDDYIVCLEDGAQLKMLKRYLRMRYNLTPDQYRAKWGLPHDYPMTCRNYSQRRSELATENGLGFRRDVEVVPVRRGRGAGRNPALVEAA